MTRSVYFIEAGAGGPIKIGVTANVPERVKDLQGASPVRLSVIVTIAGDHKDERRLHRRFAVERMSGEWFRGDGVVRAFATSLVDSTPEQRIAAIKYSASATKPKAKRLSERTSRRLSFDEWRAMFFVGDGSVYRSAEAEDELAERAARARRFR